MMPITVLRAIATPELQERFAKGGSMAISTTPRQFAAFIREETDRWAPLIRASGARID